MGAGVGRDRRPQRHGQDDALQRDHGHHAAAARAARSASRARSSSAGRRTRSRARGIGYVPQGRRLFPSLTVDEHLRIAARGRRRTGGEWTQDRVYELFPRLAERKRNGGAQLSGGEQQMLAIGRALLTQPAAPDHGRAVRGARAGDRREPDRDVQAARARKGLAILLIEQNLGVATSLAERQLVMVAGEIATETTAAALLGGLRAAAALPRRRAARPLSPCARRARPAAVAAVGARARAAAAAGSGCDRTARTRSRVSVCEHTRRRLRDLRHERGRERPAAA